MQQTIKDSFSVDGIGLHSGRRAVITVKPALEDTGIWFKLVVVFYALVAIEELIITFILKRPEKNINSVFVLFRRI